MYGRNRMPLIMKVTLISFMLSTMLSCNSGITIDKKINGATEDVVLGQYGNPQRESTIKLTKGVKLHEYQSNLYSLYPNLTLLDTVELRELFWNLKNGEKMAIWFDKKNGVWVTVDNLKWSKDIKF